MIKRKLKPCVDCGHDCYVWSRGKCKSCANKSYGGIKAKKKEPTGELELFCEIWDTRPHFSQLSGKPLLPKTHKLWIKQFIHVLNKGRFESLRLDSENILLALPEEHDRQDTFELFVKKKEELYYRYYTGDWG